MAKLARVSLQQVPEPVRRKAAQPLLAALAQDGGLASLRQSVELERAVREPSARVYLIPVEAVDAVMARR